ncbi:MGMT family protein [Patescibacteria group bacterium]
MSKFTSKVLKRVKEVPIGKVVSYGQVAAACGSPRASRHVGRILNKNDSDYDVPWWRVINNKGRITIKGSIYSKIDQKRELELEGVRVTSNFEVNINKYRYNFE